jgi:two-component system sensor histidine kinase DesK
MGPDLVPARPAETEWVAGQVKWARGWRRVVFPGIFLVYLLQVVGATADDSKGAAAAAGYAIVAAFCACYLFILPAMLAGSAEAVLGPLRRLGDVLWVAELPFARADAFVMCVFIVVVTVARLGGRSAPVVVALTLMALLIPVAVPSWHDGIKTAINNGTAISIPITALAMFGFFQVMRGNRALAEARSELARLAAENERARIARDLHDLLGHSLTTITVKAALARRLGRVGSGPRPSKRSGRSKLWPGVRWPTCVPRWPTTGRSRWRVNWLVARSFCGRLGSPPTFRPRSISSTSVTRSSSVGCCARA